MKAIILAAGSGSRLLPLTRAIPKEMIRVGSKPVIEHCIDVLKTGGIDEILIIVGRKKESILDHLGSGERHGVSIYYRVQEEMKGTANAVTLAKEFIGTDDFIVLYGDNYFKPYETINDILSFHKSSDANVTLVLHPVNDPRRYGIVMIDDSGFVQKIIEKPTITEAETFQFNDEYLSIAGLLIFKNKVFEYITKTQIGKNKEYWLTDSVELMRKSGIKVKGFIFKGRRFDIGTMSSLLEADKLELLNENKLAHL